MSLVFHKMHGAGNDFVLLDLRQQVFVLDGEHARQIADRRKGIGCDQILVLRTPRNAENTARYEIWNADGSLAGQCGNGARCIGLYLSMQTDQANPGMNLESPAGLVSLKSCDDGDFEVDMGEPDFDPGRVPTSLSPDAGWYQLESPWGVLELGAVSMGNPHAVTLCDDVRNLDITQMGPFISTHQAFPQGCNAGFAQIVDRGEICLRVYERGAGETLACGSGACAAVAVLRQRGLVSPEVNVILTGGNLVIKWPGSGQSLSMKGPAQYVYTGTVNG
jgi:diaminopimelate epimerase